MREVVTAEGETYDIELEEDLLQANRRLAEENRELLRKHGVKAIDIMGSVGSGKTSLIDRFIQKLGKKYSIAVLNGDLTTTIDSDRLKVHRVPVVQINTGRECHLDANLVQKALKKFDLEKLSLIFIENVGNIICPVEFPLGSEKRLTVVSVTEGPYIVVKHPLSFLGSDVVAINKIDLAEIVDVNVDKLEEDISKVNPRARIARVSCKSGEGIDSVLEALEL
ncbi:hydrogenase nickel incorporation protein HypB [Candidatus Hecatella orcuttiae]|jgi:hydrogenase nickel incorporation protein HypB|uniref:hydrogenase nickel incorporation protein HypB n=1 Tax=Candidatus Hecatella orcuttiae TaxID=1935119 RepID=UPI0028681F85|nr:hydrogenase nickel incorporation protein HypB [Candidatus Hecatella orcuttiae]